MGMWEWFILLCVFGILPIEKFLNRIKMYVKHFNCYLY